MNILVLGSGGREHTILWKLKQNDGTDKLFCIPGNAGICEIAECCELDILSFEQIYSFIKEKNIDFVIVGPEQPAVNGVADFLLERQIKVFCPNKNQAKLEGSKIFAKKFMSKYNIPTAEFVIADNYDLAKKLSIQMLKKFPEGVVIKADGLAFGKGAVVCKDLHSVDVALHKMFIDKSFGEASNHVLIERRILGTEISVIAFCDGKTIAPLVYAQDHKPVYENDKGPNTGGMGAYAPLFFVDDDLQKQINKDIIQRFLGGIGIERLGYNGIIYFGLMVENIGKHNQNPFVLEFNCRFGDPETQVILPLLKNDIKDIFLATSERRLSNIKLEFENKYAACVVLASKGYPEKYVTQKEITGLEYVVSMKDILVFHSGTKKVNSKILTNGGRVLSVVGKGKTLKDAITVAYSGVDRIYFENKHFRKDIGFRGLRLMENVCVQ